MFYLYVLLNYPRTELDVLEKTKVLSLLSHVTSVGRHRRLCCTLPHSTHLHAYPHYVHFRFYMCIKDNLLFGSICVFSIISFFGSTCRYTLSPFLVLYAYALFPLRSYMHICNCILLRSPRTVLHAYKARAITPSDARLISSRSTLVHTCTHLLPTSVFLSSFPQHSSDLGKKAVELRDRLYKELGMFTTLSRANVATRFIFENHSPLDSNRH